MPDWGDYLTETEKHDIAVDEFRQQIRKHTSTGNDVERVLSNIAYLHVDKQIDAIVEDNESFRAEIAQRVLGVLREMSSYNVFRPADGVWRSKPSVAQQIADEVVLAKRTVIENRVTKLLEEMPLSEIRAVLHEQIDELLRGEPNV